MSGVAVVGLVCADCCAIVLVLDWHLLLDFCCFFWFNGFGASLFR